MPVCVGLNWIFYHLVESGTFQVQVYPQTIVYGSFLASGAKNAVVNVYEASDSLAPPFFDQWVQNCGRNKQNISEEAEPEK